MSWFTDRHFFLLAVILYGASLLYSVFLWRKGFREDNRNNYLILLGAFLLHSTAMGLRGYSLSHCPLNNLYEETLFISWTIVATYLVLGLWPQMRFLGAFASPVLFIMGVFALMRPLDVTRAPNQNLSDVWGSLHGALILLSFGAFGLGAVAALMYLTQDHDLKARKLRAILSLLPPIQRLDRVVGDLVIAGLVLLTAGLSIDPILLKNKPEVTVFSDPIILWSVLVWVCYFVLIILRWRGKGGRRFAWGALASFLFILLTFWGFMLLSPLHKS
jgi:ABC-type uncharacterized transport system permease subunit